ncbi:midkine-B-like [Echeneis naucrates]|uniref:Midkine n=1 Tax=Echeneis naucrates TaxID=173247 RepID=A0A665UI14_ECHNA|nr:midkine-B-like [Echeneis naucrates]XP_029371816.1 midkine-B-like [Echeneis naucrates]
MKFVLLLLLVTVFAVHTVTAGKNKKEKHNPPQAGSECTNWRYGNCVPSNRDCGPGFREGSCDQQTRKMNCKVPCNWKRDFGADCKYRFGSWGPCDPSTNKRTRTGTLKRALFNAECQTDITVFKPCSWKPRKPRKPKVQGRRGKVRAGGLRE